LPLPPHSTLFPYTTLFRSLCLSELVVNHHGRDGLDAEQMTGQRAALPLDEEVVTGAVRSEPNGDGGEDAELTDRALQVAMPITIDRKSTRLNSSHLGISYA